MKTAIIKKSFVSLACLVFILIGTFIMASAYSSAPITAHDIPAYSTTLYWIDAGTNGVYMVAGSSILSINETFNSTGNVQVGMYEYPSGNNQFVQSYNQMYFATSMGVTVTGTYRAQVHNNDPTPLRVNSGSISVNT